MKKGFVGKLFALLLSVSLAASAALVPAGAVLQGNTVKNELTLIKEGVTLKIFLPDSATETESFAAAVLNDYFKRMTGVSAEVVRGGFENYAPYIAIGDSTYTGEEKPAFDGYSIASDENGVRITHGDGNRGSSRGAYKFLEKYCGCLHYAHDCIVVPSKKELTVPEDIRYSYSPYFEYGECDTRSSRVPEFCVSNGTTGGVYCRIPDAMGGTVSYISSFCHTLTTQYCAGSRYFESHPEYFAYYKGERTPDQLCLTNPDVLKTVTEEVMNTIRTNYNPNGGLQIISLTQNDNQHYCQCDRCKALDEANHSHAGTMITFVNAVAAEVAKLGYENIAIDTFAYQYTRDVPTDVVPLKNVIVRLCSIECCFGHTLNDSSCAQNVKFMSDLKGWSRLCNRLYVWDYVNNYNNTTSIFANFGVLQSNMQTFYENGVKGIYEEGNYYIDSCDSEFGEMKTYLLSKLMENPYCDIEKEADGFLAAYYGNGWKSIKEFIGVCTSHAATKNRHLGIYQNASDSLPGMTAKEIKRCNKLWEEAENGAVTEFQQSKVRRSEISWRVWKGVNKKSEFSRWRFFFKWIKANDELYNDMKELGIVRAGEGGTGDGRILSDTEVLHYIYTPDQWYRSYENRAVVKYNDFAVKLFNYFDGIFG